MTVVETRVSNSRFLAAVTAAPSATVAHEFIRERRAADPDAVHHVYAFRAGYGPSVVEGMSDDGEPSGTSGPPTLAVLRGSGIGDVVLVTTRYFGGTKLGTGGLVAAYTAAAKAVLAATPTELKVERIDCRISVPYPLLQRVQLLLREAEARMVDESFGDGVELRFRIARARQETLAASLRDLSSGRISIAIVD